MTGRLSERDHELMDRYLESVFDSIEFGRLNRYDFVERMALLMTALDVDAYEEVRYCFERSARDACRGSLQDGGFVVPVARAA